MAIDLRVLATLALLSVVGTAVSCQAQDSDAVKAGRDLSVKLCGRCHSVGSSGQSKLAKAPPFREIANRYSVWTLQEALAEGIVTGHIAMPEFVLNPDEINNLLTYMDTFTIKKVKPQ